MTDSPALTAMAPDLAKLREAHRKIADHVHRTPVLTSQSLNRILNARLYFKCENFQKVGAFKARGAVHAALCTPTSKREAGFATHSSGNHGAAVAYAAQLCGTSAYVVMPEGTPQVKQAAVDGYGAKITVCPPTLKDRQNYLQQVVEESGAVFVPPFDHWDVIAGQATACIELLEDCPTRLDIVSAPVGGGGLIAGTALAAHYLQPDLQVIATEPTGADDAFRSMQSGIRQTEQTPKTVADGLRTTLGERPFAVMHTLGLCRQVLRVDDDEILDAMQLVWSRMKILIEPSCAVPVAAVQRYPEVFAGKAVGIILTGGNVDATIRPNS